MRSIRLSLLVYFLGLMVICLGVESLLIYRSAERTLANKEEAVREGIEKKYEERCRKERERLNEELLKQALALADRLQLRMHWGRMWGVENHDPEPGPKDPLWAPNSLFALGAISASAAPCGYANMASWLAQVQQLDIPTNPPRRPVGPTRPGPRQGDFFRPPPMRILPFAAELWRRQVGEISLNKSAIEFPGGTRAVDYFQIDVNHWGRSLRSKSLEGRGFPDEQGFGGDKIVHWELDDFELSPGHWVRRVRLKASRLRFLPAGSIRRQRAGPLATATTPMPPEVAAAGASGTTLPATSRPSPTAPLSPPRLRQPAPVFIVLQVGADLNKLTDTLDRFRLDRDEELERQKAETAGALLNLSNQLLTIIGVTFIATVLGTWWLVWLGLVPLRRLSDAVSKVSPRDFQLHLGVAPLPTELRPIAERLSGALDLLKRAFAREKQSTADISHELRTPLAAMLATTELALRKQRSAEQYREFLEECQFSAKQMNQIVERLLTLARLDAGMDRLRPQLVDVAELAEECVAVVRPLAEAQGLHLSVVNSLRPVNDNEDSARLSTDPDKLREVLTNLLHNAIQYNRPEGRIDLMVARDNGHVRLEVRDTGIGIAEEVRVRIFERFYRADPSRTGDGMNAGLGLALVKEYVDLMGGRIDVDSVEGQGSTFRVELPVVRPVVLA